MTLEVDQFLHDKKWRFSKVLCKAWTTAYLFTVPVSILTTCLSSIDRWYAISRPLQYRTNRNGLKHKALVAIILIWIYSILFASIPEMGWNPPGDSHGVPENSEFCYFDIYLTYSILSSVLHFILPSIVTAFFYYNMFKAMKTHNMYRRRMSSGSDYSHAHSRSPSHRNHRKEQRINFRHNVSLAKSYALIGSLLILTWCPHSIISVMQNSCDLRNSKSYGCGVILGISEHTTNFLLLLGYFNSALNPIVYVLRFRQFRLTLRDWLSCHKH
ncbi:octopamine receptor beta-2R-like [Dendronephthya gigantea]|uniref:octopamine receptor beta-2R-like n=1 Tax=Dendronephthya gigantea TaxID=151771 RepID=UPI00106C69F0|nr:octopamine receptor beta-2R-like [Dendronephthya gigantea]